MTSASPVRLCCREYYKKLPVDNIRICVVYFTCRFGSCVSTSLFCGHRASLPRVPCIQHSAHLAGRVRCFPCPGCVLYPSKSTLAELSVSVKTTERTSCGGIEPRRSMPHEGERSAAALGRSIAPRLPNIFPKLLVVQQHETAGLHLFSCPYNAARFRIRISQSHHVVALAPRPSGEG